MLRKHLESYFLKVDKESIEYDDRPKCEKAFKRFIADHLSGLFPVKVDVDPVTREKVYKIDCAIVFGDNVHPIDMGKDGTI